MSVGALGTMLAGNSFAAAEDEKPNILIILADDAGYADFGFTGCDDIPTPNLDRLAREGVFCTQGYVTAAVCCPSRMGLITGRYQQRFGAECNCPTIPTPGFGKRDLGLEPSETTMADLLGRSGYRTMALGKWHLGEHPQYHPNRRGFDEFYGFLGGGRSYWPSDYAADDPHRMLHNKKALDEEKEIEYLTTDLTDKALDYILGSNSEDKPFFMYLCYNAPHAPLQAPEEYLDKFTDIERRNRRKYAAMINCMDVNIGRILDKLEDLEMRENTLIFFLSDNGGTGGHSSNKPFRGHKGTYWEGGMRVPYLVSWPGQLPEGKRYDLPVSSLDILPTSLAAAGSSIKPPKPLDGVDLLPYLNGDNTARPHQTLYWRFWRVSACRDGKWKLLKVAEDPLKKDRKLFYPLQLFNIEEDPREQKNVADKYPEVLERLSGKLENWDAELQKPRWHDGRNWKHWQEAQLKNHKEL